MSNDRLSISSDNLSVMRIMVRDTFVVALCLWAALYTFDLIKPGFASNYLSLPRWLIVVFGLALISLSLEPVAGQQSDDAPAKEPSVLLFSVFGVVAFATCLAVGLSLTLTLALAFVTLVSLWALRIEWEE